MTVRQGKREDLEREAGEFIASQLQGAVRKNGIAVLALPGGRSVTGVLRELLRQDIPWSNVHLFLADERFVPIDHPDSNYKELRELFITPLIEAGRLPERNSHPFEYDSEEADGGVSRYTREFTDVAAYIDVLVLGAGEDGHVASLFPNHPSVRSTGELYIGVDDSPKPPPRRLSISPAMVRNAKAAVLIFFGDSKSDAFRTFLAEGPSDDCPARLTAGIRDGIAVSDT